MASFSSWSALAAPLTPTPPTICPSTVIGIPPIRGVKFSSAVTKFATTETIANSHTFRIPIAFFISLPAFHVSYGAVVHVRGRSAPRSLRFCLLNGAGERSLAQIRFRPCAPDDYLRYILHIAGQNDFLLVFVARQRLLFQLVEVIDIAVGIDDLPVWIGSIRNNKVVGQREDALAVAGAVSDVSLVCLRALELARGVHILSKCRGGE